MIATIGSPQLITPAMARTMLTTAMIPASPPPATSR
jgi:hypothetical protein